MVEVLAVCGHRPDRVGGYSTNRVAEHIQDELDRLMVELKPRVVISGLNIGVETWAANIALHNNVLLWAATPFLGCERHWPPHAQDEFNRLCNLSWRHTTVTPGDVPYSPALMTLRSEFIVEHCDEVLAVHLGGHGYTDTLLKKARRRGKAIHYVEFPPDVREEAESKWEEIQNRRARGRNQTVEVPWLPTPPIPPVLRVPDEEASRIEALFRDINERRVTRSPLAEIPPLPTTPLSPPLFVATLTRVPEDLKVEKQTDLEYVRRLELD